MTGHGSCSSVKPLQLIILGKDSAERLAPRPVVLLLGVDAVELGSLAAPRAKDADVDVGRPRVGHGGDADFGEEVDAVGGGGDADGG